VEDQPRNFGRLQSHLLSSHALVIPNLNDAPLIQEYLNAIKLHISQIGFEQMKQELPNEEVEGRLAFVLKPQIAFHAKMLESLRMKLLNQLIEAQRRENTEIGPRTCLHCSLALQGTVKDLCDHMFQAHNFSVGLPDNLVHLPRLIGILQTKLDHLQCFYCEHIFKSAKVLKEHMRKKKHWRIPQQRPLYDQFYLVSYLKTNEGDQDEDEALTEEKSDENEDWQDWSEDEQTDRALCIYCELEAPSPHACFDHMATVHGISFLATKRQLGLSPYQCISWINHARQCVSESLCIVCYLKLPSHEALMEHMRDNKHLVPSSTSPVFTEPLMMIPVRPGDILLTGVDSDEEDEVV
jgi:hypothetical protein